MNTKKIEAKIPLSRLAPPGIKGELVAVGERRFEDIGGR